MKKSFLALLILFMAFTKPVAAQQYSVPVYTVTSTIPPQPGAEPAKCIDGDDNTIFHSKWDITGIPDTLDFYFSNISNIDSVEYTPRPTGPNGIWGNVEIWYSTATAPSAFVKAATLSWTQNNVKKAYAFSGAGIDNPYIVRFVVKSGYGDFSSCAEMRFFSAVPQDITACTVPAGGLSAFGDLQMTISSATASSYQPGGEITKSFDGNTGTLYHSNWSGGGFPIDLTYNFVSPGQVDYIVYTPRQDGSSNGLFGHCEIWYQATSGGSFTKLMDYDCGEKNTPSKINFTTPLSNPTAIRIRVLDGGNNFASCAEMQFFRKNTQSLPYQNVFTDNLYSGLLPGITQAKIDTISSAFFRGLAQCLYDGTYNNKFRVQEYGVYPTIGTTAAKLKTGTYNQFENPTGIYFDSAATAVLFVDEYQAPGISLRVRDFAKDDQATDDTYFLSSGCNIITIKHAGMAYISYFDDDSTLQPVKINIVTGKVNGYFDAANDSNHDWITLMSNKTYPEIDIKGRYINLMYNKAALKANCPFDGVGLAATYDSVVWLEYQLMGLVKYNRVPKNHMFAYSNASGGYYAGGIGAHFDLSWGTPNITSISGIDLWGVAHELGHINQARPGMKWIGLTEVTNNLYSAYVNYYMSRTNKYTTRLEIDYGQADSLSPNTAGGRFDSYLETSLLRNEHIQTQNVFNILTPLWQLELYYEVAGACKDAPSLWDEMNGTVAPPAAGVDYAHWLPDVFEKVRNTNETGLSNGRLLLNFVSNTCDAVHEDLTDFFVRSGFLRPVDMDIDDYGVGHLLVTQQQIDSIVSNIKSRGYAQPVSPNIYYLSSNSVDAYKDKLSVAGTAGTGVTLSGGALTIDHDDWQHVAAFETYQNDSLIHITIAGTGDATNAATIVQYPENATSVYAVGFDGKRVQVYPEIHWYKIRNAYSGKYLGIEDSSSANSATVVQYSNSGSYSLQWRLDIQKGAYILINRKSGKAMDLPGSVQASGTHPIQYTITNSQNQQWKVIHIGGDTCLIQSNMSNHYILDDPASSTAEGEQMIIYPKSGSIGGINQRWILEDEGTGGGMVGNAPLNNYDLRLAQQEEKLWPNPVHNILHFSTASSNEGGKLYIYNAMGKLVKQTDMLSTHADINVASLQTGVYFLMYAGRTFRFLKL